MKLKPNIIFREDLMINSVWNSYVSLFSGNKKLAVLAAVPILVTALGIIVRGFVPETWAANEYYPDAYYYLSFAKYAARGDFFSYAGVGPTSGIHPLHWLNLTAVYAVTGGNLSWMFPILFSIYSFAFLITTWAALYTLKMLGIGAGILLSFVLAMTYSNYLAISLNIPVRIPVIFNNFVNMMESWLVVSMLALLIVAVVRQLRIPKRGDWILVAVASMLVVWARIDYLFIVFPLVTVVAWHSRNLTRWQRVILLGAAPFAAVLWLFILKISTGVAIPTSGIVKSAVSLESRADPGFGLGFFRENILTAVSTPDAVIALMGTFVSGALLVLVMYFRSSKRTPVSYAFMAILGGILAHFAYHMTLTFALDIGEWYYRPYRFVILVVVIFAIGSWPRIHALSQNSFFNRPLVAMGILATVWIVISQLTGPSIYKDRQSGSEVMQNLVHQLDGIVEPTATFYDWTDGVFGWHGEYTAYHVKGMANTPDYQSIGQKYRLLGPVEMIPIYADYIEKMKIDYVVAYSGVSDKQGECWTILSVVASVGGGQSATAYVARSADWLEFIKCHPRDIFYY
jgi:hypothetical protein